MHWSLTNWRCTLVVAASTELKCSRDRDKWDWTKRYLKTNPLFSPCNSFPITTNYNLCNFMQAFNQWTSFHQILLFDPSAEGSNEKQLFQSQDKRWVLQLPDRPILLGTRTVQKDWECHKKAPFLTCVKIQISRSRVWTTFQFLPLSSGLRVLQTACTNSSTDTTTP